MSMKTSKPPSAEQRTGFGSSARLREPDDRGRPKAAFGMRMNFAGGEPLPSRWRVSRFIVGGINQGGTAISMSSLIEGRFFNVPVC